MMKMKKTVLVFSLSLLAGQAFANQSTTGNVLRSIEQNNFGNNPFVKEQESTAVQQSEMMTSESIEKLARVEINASSSLKKEMEKYFTAFMDKPVSSEELEKFNIWIWEKLTEQGYLAYVTTRQQQIDGKTVLFIDVQQPVVSQFRVNSGNEKIADQYEQRIIDRFSKAILVNKPLDLQFLENQISSASFEFPIDIRANVQQSAPEKIEVVLSLSNISSDPGAYVGGFLQANNYGLRRYGKGQILGSVTVNGFTSLSQLNITSLVSEGIKYGNIRYEFPSSTLAGKVNLWSSYADTKSILGRATDTTGESSELGIGLTKVIRTTRNTVYKSNLEVMSREARSSLKSSDIRIENLRDEKVRLSFTADNDALSVDHYKYQVGLTAGRYNTTGNYNKQEISGQIQKSLTDHGEWTAGLRFHGQIASTNLDSYDKIALGGVNGVRAYSSDDGVGDEGFGFSIDLVKHFYNKQYAGVFYDAGLVKPNNDFVAGSYNSSYSLQGLGIQWGGIIDKNLSYSMAVAKGIGPYSGYLEGNIESEPRDLRFLIAVSGQF